MTDKSDAVLGQQAVGSKLIDQAQLDELTASLDEHVSLAERLLVDELVEPDALERLLGRHKRQVYLSGANRYLRSLRSAGLLTADQIKSLYDDLRARTKQGEMDLDLLATLLGEQQLLDEDERDRVAAELEVRLGAWLGCAAAEEAPSDHLLPLRAAYQREMIDDDRLYRVLERLPLAAASLPLVMREQGRVSDEQLEALGLPIPAEAPAPRDSGRVAQDESGRVPEAAGAPSGKPNQLVLLGGGVGALIGVIAVVLWLGGGGGGGASSQAAVDSSPAVVVSSAESSSAPASASSEPASSAAASSSVDPRAAELAKARQAIEETIAKGDWQTGASLLADYKLLLEEGGAVAAKAGVSALEDKLAEVVDKAFAIARREFEALIAKKDHEAAQAALDGLVDMPLRDRSPLATLRKQLAEIKPAEPAKGPVAEFGPPKKKPEGAEWKAELARQRELVAKARAALAAERAEHKRLLDRRAKHVVVETQKYPVRFKIANLDLGECQVKSYDDRGVYLKGRNFALKVPWKRMSVDQIYAIKRRAIPKDDAKGWYDLARYLAFNRSFKDAERCYAKAVKADASYSERVPDLEPLKKSSKSLFIAPVHEPSKDRIKVSWSFDKALLAKDFAGRNVTLDARKGKLLIKGKLPAFVTTPSTVKFKGEFTLSGKGMDGAEGGLSGFGVVLLAGRRQAVLMACREADGKLGIYRFVQGKGLERYPKSKSYPLGKSDEVTLAYKGNQLRMLVDQKEVWKARVGGYSDLKLVVGGQLPKPADGELTLGELELEAKVDPAWLDKAEDERQSRLLRALEFDLKLHDIKQQKTSFPVLDLEWLPTLPEEIASKLTAAVNLIKTGYETKNGASIQTGFRSLDAVAKLAPEHPAVRFYLGEKLRRQGSNRLALRHFTAVVEKAPQLFEGHLFRALVLPNLQMYDEGLLEVEKALAIQPASSDAMQLKGLILFWKTHDLGIDELEVARILAPTDLGIHRSLKDVKHIQSGPNFLPNEKKIEETAHYRVITNFSKSKVKEYVQHLEAVYKLMDDFFKPERKGKQELAELVLFRTKEGYQTFAELTLNNRVDNTLGYYHPHYRQIYLYEGLDARKTKWVMIHEAFHQYIAKIIPVMPQWVNEGLAEYFGATDVEDGKVTGTGLIQKGRLANLKAYLRARRTPVDFKKLMLMTRAQMYDRRMIGVHYAQAWAMVHFFFNTPDYKPILMEYLKVLREGATTQEAFDTCWAKVDLAKATTRFMAYVNQLK